MYDIRQFKPSLYLLLVMGMSGLRWQQSPGIWILSVAGILLNAWLVKTDRFRPLPRLVANLITVVALLWAFQALRQADRSADHRDRAVPRAAATRENVRAAGIATSPSSWCSACC